ncbi:hypothetical protein VNO77_02615 [Canavalia gladiata]|uniref:Uncharacterized protein n=1 Tax=Canavalia gladiata TaxID=3824 RepID=A0AAN9MZT6_CANGL
MTMCFFLLYYFSSSFSLVIKHYFCLYFFPFSILFGIQVLLKNPESSLPLSLVSEIFSFCFLLTSVSSVTVGNLCSAHYRVFGTYYLCCLLFALVLMIIKGLFRRYKRWNPVHPTYGAFWGMGVGIGCGIGWGPGFGPEVIGYVGAGCGIGFNVGITFTGFGVGLPAKFVFEAPYNAIMATQNSAMELVRSNGLLSGTHMSGVSWIRNISCVSDLQRKASEQFLGFSEKHLSIKGIDLFVVNNSLPLLTSSACKRIQAFHSQFCSRKARDKAKSGMLRNDSSFILLFFMMAIPNMRYGLKNYTEVNLTFASLILQGKIDDFHNCQFCGYDFERHFIFYMIMTSHLGGVPGNQAGKSELSKENWLGESDRS